MSKFAIITVSDTRTPATDQGGDYLVEALTTAGHTLAARQLVPDERAAIAAAYQACDRQVLDAILITGGTGIALRDVTIETIAPMLVKTIPGFGEHFRRLSVDEVGLKALASRAEAGVSAANHLTYLLPGSLNALHTAVERIILPDLPHLIKELTKDVHTR